MKNKTAYILFIVILFLSTSCEKEERTTRYNYLPENIRPYIFFTGSFWVYQNDLTLEKETIIITKTEHDQCVSYPSVHGSNSSTNSEYFKMSYETSNPAKNYFEFVVFDAIYRNGGSEYCRGGQPVFTANGYFGYNYEGLMVTGKYSTYLVNGKLFKNVTKVRINAEDPTTNLFQDDTEFYYAPYVGVIKKVIYKSGGGIDSWSLTNFYITH